MKYLLLLTFLAIPFAGSSQIALGKEFRCVPGETFRDDHYSDGVLNFYSQPLGNSDLNNTAESVIPYLQNVFGNHLLFKKTTDGLYWTTGYYQGKYWYIIAIPRSLIEIILSCPTKSSRFSNYSAWILQQVRITRDAGKDYFFSDYKGATCRQ